MMNWWYARSIQQKMLSGILLTTVTGLLIAGFAIVSFELRDYRQRLLVDLQTQSHLLGLASAPALQFNDPKLAADSLALIRARPEILAAAIYDTKGRLFASHGADAVRFTPLYAGGFLEGSRIEGNTLTLAMKLVDHDELLGTFYLSARYELRERLWQYGSIVFVALGFSLLISMLLSLWMQSKVARPILRITQLARSVTETRDYALRAEKDSDDEIGYLVDAFNTLLAEVGTRSAALEDSNAQLQQHIEERHLAEMEILRLNAGLEQRVAERTAELERTNKELEAFSYSVSHDLRTPLRAIDGFSQAVLEDYEERLDATGLDYLNRVRAAAQRMGHLIDDLLKLARVSRTPLSKTTLNLSAIAEEVISELRGANPDRQVDVEITPALAAIGDARLLRIVLENLLNNAWKYSSKRAAARIEFGRCQRNDNDCFYVRDNGAGFDMAYANKLFGAFQRLHDVKEFPGTGVGLATVQRIIHRHGGQIDAESAVDIGSTFYFTLPADRGDDNEHTTDSFG